MKEESKVSIQSIPKVSKIVLTPEVTNPSGLSFCTPVCTPEIEEKFIAYGNKQHIYVNGKEEIKIFTEYLQYDFVYHESQKIPGSNLIQDEEFIVSCDYGRYVLSEYRSGLFGDILADFGGETFDEKIAKAIPLKIFLESEKYPEYFL